jgi:amino-acid N-acetyltransferase
VVSGNFIIAQPLGVDDGVDYCHSGIHRIDEEAITASWTAAPSC